MKFNVLVFPSNSQAAIDINFALRHAVRIELFGASSKEDHGKYVYKNYICGLPNIADDNFLNMFNIVLQKHNIDFIIPTHDTVALFLKECESQLAAKVITADLNTVRISRYKSLTYKHFSDYSFIPTIYLDRNQVNNYPVFLKPDDGQGGKDAFVVENKQELLFYLNKYPKHLICEYLPGDEISVDCFTDRHGKLRIISPRKRERTISGVSVHSILINQSMEIEETAKQLNQKLSFRGHWFFQMKQDKNGHYKLMEIASRMAGTSALTIARGINLPLLSILDFAGLDVDIKVNEYSIELDRSFINRYEINIAYERVYIDLDDTLIVNNKINTLLLMFLYQCINEQKELILITKHEYYLDDTLLKYKLNPMLFEKIILLNPDEKKYKHINNDKPAIFIDNSFNERLEVQEILNIPCFDVNNVECLIDWKG